MSTPTIYVIRHAEKPEDNSYLSQAGFERAEKLAPWFVNTFGMPDLIFAAQPSRKSQRPFQTVAPLARHAGHQLVDMEFDNDSYDLLAEWIRKNHRDYKKIVVCWHHGRIPHLMHELGAKSGEYPKPWDKDVFDLILELEYEEGGSKVTHHKMPF
jgi:phosphohistidine phosphatase SixA